MLINTIRLDRNVFVIQPGDFSVKNIQKLAEDIENFIKKEDCDSITLDLRALNLFDSIKIGVLAATYQFLKSANHNIFIIVNNFQAQKSIEMLGLNNATVIFDKNTNSPKYSIA